MGQDHASIQKIRGVTMEEKKKCPVCITETLSYPDYERVAVFYTCPVCGRFEISAYNKFDYNKFAPYLAHNRLEPIKFCLRWVSMKRDN